jgi:hypothetical protein
MWVPTRLRLLALAVDLVRCQLRFEFHAKPRINFVVTDVTDAIGVAV